MEVILSYSPIAAKIAEYLNFISRLSLAKVFPVLKVKIPLHMDFNYQVRKRLAEMFQSEEKAIKLLQVMQETQTYMSGSFVLKCLTDGDFECGDIDFFTNNYIPNYECEYTLTRTKVKKENNKLIEENRKIIELGYEYVSKFSNKLYNNFDHTIVSPIVNIRDVREGNQEFTVTTYQTRTQRVIMKDGRDEENPNAIKCIRNFYINDIKLQDIIIDKRYPVKEYISEIFDLDFLKNMFDGKTLTILKPESILKQKTTVNMFQSYYKSFWKIRYTNSQKSYIETQVRRIMKYENRGFKVDINFAKDTQLVEKICEKWGWKPNNPYKVATKDKKLKIWDNLINMETITQIKNKLQTKEDYAAKDDH